MLYKTYFINILFISSLTIASMGLFDFFKNKDKGNDYPASSETQYSVNIPEESFTCADLSLGGKP